MRVSNFKITGSFVTKVKFELGNVIRVVATGVGGNALGRFTNSTSNDALLIHVEEKHPNHLASTFSDSDEVNTDAVIAFIVRVNDYMIKVITVLDNGDIKSVDTHTCKGYYDVVAVKDATCSFENEDYYLKVRRLGETRYMVVPSWDVIEGDHTPQDADEQSEWIQNRVARRREQSK